MGTLASCSASSDWLSTDMLTAARQLNSCKLLLIVFLKCRSELGGERGCIDRECFDIYRRPLALHRTARTCGRTCYHICELEWRSMSKYLAVIGKPYLSWRRTFHKGRYRGKGRSHTIEEDGSPDVPRLPLPHKLDEAELRLTLG